MVTRKNKVICYTGIHSRKNGKHTIKNFRKITRKLYPSSECKDMKRRKKNLGFGSECPKTTNGWINFFGAIYTSPEKCDSIVKTPI